MNWLHIDNWLKSIYKENEKIPDFERTDKNYDILNNLKKLNLKSTELIENVLNHLDYIKTTTANYHLSSSGHESLYSLALNAYLLGLDKTELSNYITAITKLSTTQLDLNLQEYNLDEIQYKLNNCQNIVNEELHHMKNILNKLRDDSSKMTIQKRRLKEGTDGLKKVTSQYLVLESKYHALDIEQKGIRLNHLQDLDLKANSIELELKEKNNILNTTYHSDLPAEMVLASIKIGETQDQLHELEVEREHLLSEIANSVLP